MDNSNQKLAFPHLMNFPYVPAVSLLQGDFTYLEAQGDWVRMIRNLVLLGIIGCLLSGTLILNTGTSQSAPPPQSTPDVIEPGDYGGTILSAGLLRRYFFHIPEGYDGETLMPMLISYHGFTSTPQENETRTGFSLMADEEGFIVVYPEGYTDPAGWFAQDDAELDYPDDVQFTRDLIQDMRSRYTVDPTRIYITGFSNGGGMAHRIGCDLANTVAAVAAVGGTHLDEDPCHPARAVPMLGIHGIDDQVTPYTGLVDTANDLRLESIPEWAREWAGYDGCDLTPVTDRSQDNLVVDRWTNCDGGAEVVLYSYVQLGHRWHRDASKIIWEFMSQFNLPQELVQDIGESDQPDITQPGDYRITLFSQTDFRSYILHVPVTYDPKIPTPVVISFHDFSSNPIGNVQLTRLTIKADEAGFIVVFPQGRGEPLSWYTDADAPDDLVPDTVFFTDMLERLNQDLTIDNDRVYLAGFSLGGGMAHRIACDRSELVAGIVVVGGAQFVDQPCQPDNAVPVLAFHALDDSVVPFEGIEETLMPVDQWIGDWALRNNCGDAQRDDLDSLNILTYQDCDAPVSLYLLNTGGHHWFPAINDIMWAFFSE